MMAADQWERRNGGRVRDGWHWYGWELCTEAEARRVTGLRSWEVRRVCECTTCCGTGRVPAGATAVEAQPSIPADSLPGGVVASHRTVHMPGGQAITVVDLLPAPGVTPARAPLTDERILHLWDTHVAYETNPKRPNQPPLSDKDKLAFAHAVLATPGVDGMRVTEDTEAAFQRGKRAGYSDGFIAGRDGAAPSSELSAQDRADLRVAACVFKSTPYNDNPQAQRVAATLARLGGVKPAGATPSDDPEARIQRSRERAAGPAGDPR